MSTSHASNRAAYVVKHGLCIRETCDPPHCHHCDLAKRIPGVMEHLGRRICRQNSMPNELVRLDAWFCPICGALETERPTKPPVMDTSALLYEPPRCGYPIFRGGMVIRAEEASPMRRVGRRVKQGNSYFEEYRCRLCSHRARVLIRDRLKPLVLTRGREIAQEALRHDGELIGGCSANEGCKASRAPSQTRYEVAGIELLLSICPDCHGFTYELNPPAGVGIREL